MADRYLRFLPQSDINLAYYANFGKKMNFDGIDRQIIRALQENGRITNNELSKRVNLSPSPCLRRIRNLEEKGYITGYTANVDQEKYGLPISIFVSIRLEKQNEEMLRVFEDEITHIDEVVECYLMTGGNDYLLRVVTDSLAAYEIMLKKKITHIPGIASIQSSFALGIVKQSKIFPKLSQFEHKD